MVRMNTTPSPQPLRLGVLGCANIARQFIAAVRQSPAVKVVAVASRDAATAAAFAAANQVQRHHGSYQALLDDPGVDAIYLPLPNSLHAEWAMRAARAGKHVLCEKPLSVGAQQARTMFATARQHGVMLLEAYPWWFQPQTRDLVALLAPESGLGPVQSVQASFGFTMSQPAGNIRLAPDLGGGALLDAGSYTVSLVRLVMGSAPDWVTAHPVWASSGVDMRCTGTLIWADGRSAQISCAMDVGYHRHAHIVCSQGSIETEYLNHTADGPGHPLGYQASQLRVRRSAASTVPLETVRSATGSGFRFCAEAFADVVARGDTAAIDRAAAASVDIAATLEALALSARAGRMVDLSE